MHWTSPYRDPWPQPPSPSPDMGPHCTEPPSGDHSPASCRPPRCSHFFIMEHTVGKWAVCILRECLLVELSFSHFCYLYLCIIPFRCFHLFTRKHSSRMHTTSFSDSWAGGLLTENPLHRDPLHRDSPCTETSRQRPAPCGQTNTCENIILPQISFAGGNNCDLTYKAENRSNTNVLSFSVT